MLRRIIFIFVLLCPFFGVSQLSLAQLTVVSGLNYPVAFTITPDFRFLVTLKGHDATTTNCDSSVIKCFDAQGNFLNTFFQLDGDSNFCFGETGILGICLDADYSSNKYVYFYYNHAYAGDTSIRIVRLTDVNNYGTNPTIILDIPTLYITQQHVGGNIRCSSFHPGKIFVSIGDLADNSNPQDLSKPYGKILRINTDGTIPADNPFYDDGNPLTGNDDRIYTYGHRNPFDFCISNTNGKIYGTENGWNAWDEVNLIEAGKNYGWPLCEGFYQFNSTTVPCSSAGATDPLTDWAAPLPALTGIEYYTGTVIPGLANQLVVADNDYGKIYFCRLVNSPAYDSVDMNYMHADLTSSGGLTTVMQGPDECIYAMKGGFTGNGEIYRLCPFGIGVGETTAENIQLAVFPTPASEELNVQSEVPVSAEIFDLEGKIVFRSERKAINHKLPAAQLLRGMYFLKCMDESGRICVRKISIQ
jgi:glucose/arabinose dehydrogenase